MKFALLLTLLTVSTSAFAIEATVEARTEVPAKELPASLICAAPKARSPGARRFKITKLNNVDPNDQPETTLREGFQEMTMDSGMVTISFSDECEGWYAVQFTLKDLKALKAGQISRLKGELEYDDLAEFFPDVSDPKADNQRDKTPVVCKISKAK